MDILRGDDLKDFVEAVQSGVMEVEQYVGRFVVRKLPAFPWYDDCNHDTLLSFCAQCGEKVDGMR